MGLPIRVETRSGDTPSDRKARQRIRPPHILLTTPESLSLLLSYPDSALLFENLQTVVIDEIHAFAREKRGDLLSLALARLQHLAPQVRRVGLSATIADPDAYRAWLAPDGDIDAVRLVAGEPGAEPDLSILIPEGRVPWSGHSGRYAAAQVMELVEQHKTTLIFCNTRSLAELIFQDLWKANDQALPIGIHHGSLSLEARRKVEAAMGDGRLRALVATASLDLGIDWGDVDLVIQMGAPKGSSRLLQRIGRANHRLDEPSRGMVVPGNRFEYLEARAALDAIDDRELDPDIFRPGALDVLAQHILGIACAGPFDEAELLAEIRSAAPYSGLKARRLAARARISSPPAATRFAPTTSSGGWSRKHPVAGGSPGPQVAGQHRLNAGVIVDNPMMDVRFANGRKLGKVEEGFGSTLVDRRPHLFRRAQPGGDAVQGRRDHVRASSGKARLVTYGGQRMSMSTHLADRVRGYLADDRDWHRFPDDVREWLEVQQRRSILPQPERIAGRDLPARQAPLHGRLQLRRLERAPVARHAADQADGDRRASSRSASSPTIMPLRSTAWNR